MSMIDLFLRIPFIHNCCLEMAILILVNKSMLGCLIKLHLSLVLSLKSLLSSKKSSGGESSVILEIFGYFFILLLLQAPRALPNI